MPCSSGCAVPFSVDRKEVAVQLLLAMKVPFGPHLSYLNKNSGMKHRLVPFTLQRVIAFMSLILTISSTVQLNFNVLPGHVGELGAVNSRPSTSPIKTKG